MTGQPRPIDDATIEAALARRAPGHADATLLADIVAQATSTPQVHGRSLSIAGRRRAAWALLAAAVLLVGGVLVILGGGSERITPTPAPSQPGVVAPSVSVSAAASPASVATCATQTTTVTTGAEMPPTTTPPMTVPQGVLDKGVYISRRGQDASSGPADVWSIGAGPATRIASMTGSEADFAQIDAISDDGRVALLEVGNLAGGPISACLDLYAVRTDGTGATRLTNNGAQESASGARFSSDGRYVAFRYDDLSGHTPAVGLVDLEGDRTPRLTECAETAMFDLAWAPDDDRLAVVCGNGLGILRPDLALAPTSTDLPFSGEALVELSWQDSETTLVTTAVIDGSTEAGPPINAPIQFRTVAAGAVSQPTVVSPPIGQGNAPSAISPDGHALAVFATPSDFEASGWFVIDLPTATATRVSTLTCSDIGWSADSQSVLYVEHDLATGQSMLTAVHLGSGQAERVAPVPVNYQQGFWRGR